MEKNIQKKTVANTKTQQSSNSIQKLLFNYSIKKEFSQVLESLEAFKNELERVNIR